MENNRIRGFAIAFLVIAGLGFADAAYLTVEHYTHSIPPCVIVHGCEVVTTSKYAVVAGIPVALAGAAYYLVMVIGSLLVIETKRAAWLKWLSAFSMVGLLSSIYLIILQAFVLHSYCIYCLGSAASSTILAILGAIVWMAVRPTVPPPTPAE